jgi:CheY-like chemotaxis protein
MTTTTAARHVLVVDDDRALRLAITALLEAAGYRTVQAGHGPEALEKLRQQPIDLMLLDIGLPGMSGLDVLARAREGPSPPRVVMMTADDTPEALLQSFRGQAHWFVRKPFAPARIVEVVSDVLSASDAAALPITVVSARPEWLELIAPCSLEVAERVQDFVMQLDAKLPDEVRESVAQAFRELLSNAIEWGGRLDPARTVRISCLRSRRMLLYRIADPGEGFDIDRLKHAAISNPDDDPLEHHRVRQDLGLRPGGLGLVMTRALVDELMYNEKRNEVVLIKYLD